MNRIVYKKQAVCWTVWIIIVCAMLLLWPLRLVKETVVSEGSGRMTAESEEITADYTVEQMFIAQYDRLKNIDIYFTGGTIGEQFNFVLYDRKMNVLMQQIIDTENMKDMPGFCTVQVNIDTEVGREYYFLLQGLAEQEADSFFRVAYENTEDSGNIYNGTLCYGNVEDTERYMIAAYEYEMPLRKGRTFACDALLLLVGLAVTYAVYRYYGKHPERNGLVTVEQIVKTVCNPLIVLAGLGALAAVWPCRLFTANTVSVVFYAVGIILTAAVLLYAVNHDRTGCASDRTVLNILGKDWQNYLQSALFAGAIWACCNYMNGLYELHHTIAFRQLLLFSALAVIVTYKGKDIFNLVNLLYAAAAAFVGFRYYTKTAASMEDPEEAEILALKLTVWAGVLAGLVIIGTVRFLVRGQIRDIYVWYGILVAAFFALLIWRRNTRGWPIYLVCTFGLFYLNMAAWDKKAMLLRNICNGILFHFGASVIYCLLHRPYMFYRYYRYPFIFHTVTMTGVYLALAVAAALVKFLDAYRRRPRLSAVYKELFVLGASSVYLLLTLSRTGYLAVMAMALVLVFVVCFPMKHRWRGMLQSVGMALLALLVCFPIVFTAQRTIPAVVARPILHEIEELPVEIVHGRYTDSEYYITVQRFIQVFQMKILGMPEDRCLPAQDMVGAAEEGHSLLSADRGEILLASAQDVSVDMPEESGDTADDEASYANGRLYIFRTYYRNLNKIGHDDMGIMEPDGNYIAHAHNIYLQVAYDHGIYVGFVFILLGAGTFVQSLLYYRSHKNDRDCAALPLAVLIFFAVAGLTEWIFHPCNPAAYCLLLAMTPLLADRERNA